MNKKSEIIITIGEKGTIFTIHDATKITNKIFFENFDDEVKKTLKTLLVKNKSKNIYIILDTLDQSFKKKNFPAIKKSDLKLLIKRETENDPDKDSIKNHMILEKMSIDSTAVKTSQVMFISCSLSKNAKDIIDFIYELPNRLIGIYLYAIESVNIINSINKFENKVGKDEKSESKINCLVTKNKISGMRQTIYHNNQILFTRLLDYDSSYPDFIKRYEKDLYASFEYLRRIFPEISITKFHITNILSKDAIDIISKMTNIEFNINSHTPAKIAKIIDPKFQLNETTKNSDLIISRVFFQAKKKILKFSTQDIDKSTRLYLFMKLSYFINMVILLLIGTLSINSISKISKSEEMINVVEVKKLNSSNELEFTKKRLSDKEKELKKQYQDITSSDQLIAISQISEDLNKLEDTPLKEYIKLAFLKKHNAKITNILYKEKKFKPENVKKQKYVMIVNALVVNKSGDVDELFTKYDDIKSELEKKYSKDYIIKINELPKNINFAKKYYDFDIQINIENK